MVPLPCKRVRPRLTRKASSGAASREAGPAAQDTTPPLQPNFMSRRRLSELVADHGRVVLEGLPASGLAYWLSRQHPAAPTVVVCSDETRAETLASDLRTFGVKRAAWLPGSRYTPFDPVSPDPALVGRRFALRHALQAGRRPDVLVASASTLMGRWMPWHTFQAATRCWRPGDEVARETLSEHCRVCGYQRVSLVEDEGTFAVRGGIVDIYPPAASWPLRVDLFGDEIASIKTFDPQSQRTRDEAESVCIHPIRDVIFEPETIERAVQNIWALAEQLQAPTRQVRRTCEEIEQRHYFFGIEGLWPCFYDATEPLGPDWLNAATVVLDEPERLSETAGAYWERAVSEHDKATARHQLALPVEQHVWPPEALAAALAARPQVRAVRLADDRTQHVLPHALSDWSTLGRALELRRQDPNQGHILDPLVAELERWRQKGAAIVLACHSRGSAEKLRELLLPRGWDLPVREGLPTQRALADGHRSIAVAPLSAGLADATASVAILTDVEIFGVRSEPRRKAKPKPPTEGLTTLRDLQEGALVVHTDFGVGRYLGLERLILNGVDGDYVTLEYAGGDKLYLPVYRLNVLQPYRGPQGAEPRLDRLGSNRWQRTKQRVKDEVLALAHRVLEAQARRKLIDDLALPPPDAHFRELEATFPYEETRDQQKAIDEVIADLTAGPPMDRLVCGDVGFGKTEVAVRAAYLAVLAGKQVAVLVPTTVLAEQHGMTFRERLEGEGVRVAVLSRFRSKRQVQDILARLRRGEVDVLIGTHRMLSSDVAFRHLGLLVVDEEQRFGVRHKERIKQLKAGIHVLTLTATPIPRTLHMATVGLRDLSIIQTPPSERTSIRTEVTRFDEALITEAIRRELHRGGQVFVVHNRIQSIDAMERLIQRLIPEARTVVAHGQMSTPRLERIMVDFMRREHNVLICTAIIESGIDIPNANTMLVNRADTFGLSQLHQLRGRIGRSRERAYAYLLLPRSQQVTREASERLGVLKRFSELGAGFQIASQDMDLRGAGDLLGRSQSGQIAAVGFELYTELLADAVERARGQGAGQAAVEPEIKLPVTAVLPETYVPQPMHRLEYYRRMAQAPSDAAVFDVCGELADVYGEPPDEVQQLAEVMVIRRRLVALGVSQLSGDVISGVLKLGLSFVPEAQIDRTALAQWVMHDPERYQILPSGKLVIAVPDVPDAAPREMLRAAREAVGALPQMASPKAA